MKTVFFVLGLAYLIYVYNGRILPMFHGIVKKDITWRIMRFWHFAEQDARWDIQG
jgi:hypothetical protein